MLTTDTRPVDLGFTSEVETVVPEAIGPRPLVQNVVSKWVVWCATMCLAFVACEAAVVVTYLLVTE